MTKPITAETLDELTQLGEALAEDNKRGRYSAARLGDFHRTANPETVLALVVRIRELETEKNHAHRAGCQTFHDFGGSPGLLNHDNDTDNECAECGISREDATP